MLTVPFADLQVIAVRYWGSSLIRGEDCALDGYDAAGLYEQAGVSLDVRKPRLPEDQTGGEHDQLLGLLGGAIADVTAAARCAGKAVLMVGGNCHHATGILGGLQDAHGAAARIGLVWFDAHGDFNTPHTTLSGSLGGMPVAVCAGLAWPRWRELSHIAAPLPTDRILLVDVRNLDPPEAQLVRATGVAVAAPAPGFPGADLRQAVADLAGRCDMLYLHIDADVLDESLVPHHGTKEPDGPDMKQVRAAIDLVMETGKVVAYAVVSVYCNDKGDDVASGIELIQTGLSSWRRYGLPDDRTGCACRRSQ